MAVRLAEDDPTAVALVEAIHGGRVDELKGLLRERPSLAAAQIACGDGVERSLLHVASDWPAHFPNGAVTVRALVGAGADVNARNPPHTETALHWAASSDDVAVLDALLDGGADIEADGAVIAGGTPLDDAVAFAQWKAARRLVERGARTALHHAAALGLMDRVRAHFDDPPPPAPVEHPWGASADPPPRELDVAFWCACHGGQREVAAYLLEQGADRNWVSPWDGLTPLDAAVRAEADELAAWLRQRGATTGLAH